MTREELLKAYYDDRPTEPYSSDDCPTDWSRIAEYAENNLEKAYNRIAELEAYNEKLLDGDIEKHNKIVELQNRNGELAGQKASLERWLGEAKELIKRLIKATYGEGWNYSLDWKVEAEQFLKESE